MKKICAVITENGKKCDTTPLACKSYCSLNKNKKSNNMKSEKIYQLQRAVSAETLDKNILSSDVYEYITLNKIPNVRFARVGTVDSSLFSGIAFGRYYDEYMKYDSTERKVFTDTLKNTFFDLVSSEKWVQHISPDMEKIVFDNIIYDINTYLQSKTPSGILSWLNSVDYTDYIKSILSNINLDYTNIKQELPNKIKQQFPTLPIQMKDISIIIGESIDKTYCKYKKISSAQPATLYEIQLISDKFGINIFVFDSDGNLRNDISKSNISKPSLLLFNKNNYWEPIVQVNDQFQTILFPAYSKLIANILKKK